MNVARIQELAEQVDKHLHSLLKEEDFLPIPEPAIAGMVFQRCVAIENMALIAGFFDGRYAKETLITKKGDLT